MTPTETVAIKKKKKKKDEAAATIPSYRHKRHQHSIPTTNKSNHDDEEPFFLVDDNEHHAPGSCTQSLIGLGTSPPPRRSFQQSAEATAPPNTLVDYTNDVPGSYTPALIGLRTSPAPRRPNTLYDTNDDIIPRSCTTFVGMRQVSFGNKSNKRSPSFKSTIDTTTAAGESIQGAQTLKHTNGKPKKDRRSSVEKSHSTRSSHNRKNNSQQQRQDTTKLHGKSKSFHSEETLKVTSTKRIVEAKQRSAGHNKPTMESREPKNAATRTGQNQETRRHGMSRERLDERKHDRVGDERSYLVVMDYESGEIRNIPSTIYLRPSNAELLRSCIGKRPSKRQSKYSDTLLPSASMQPQYSKNSQRKDSMDGRIASSVSRLNCFAASGLERQEVEHSTKMSALSIPSSSAQTVPSNLKKVPSSSSCKQSHQSQDVGPPAGSGKEMESKESTLLDFVDTYLFKISGTKE